MAKKPEYGLLIDYEYCTGCHTCQVACAQEYGWAAGMSGMQVIEMVQKLPKGKLPDLPALSHRAVYPVRPRTKKGLEPACVKHCMAACMKYGPVEELAKEMTKKARTVLWVPR